MQPRLLRSFFVYFFYEYTHIKLIIAYFLSKFVYLQTSWKVIKAAPHIFRNMNKRNVLIFRGLTGPWSLFVELSYKRNPCYCNDTLIAGCQWTYDSDILILIPLLIFWVALSLKHYRETHVPEIQKQKSWLILLYNKCGATLSACLYLRA